MVVTVELITRKKIVPFVGLFTSIFVNVLRFKPHLLTLLMLN